MVYYLDDDSDEGMGSLAKGIYKFFPMFEYNAAVSLFKIEVILFAVLRLSSNDILSSPLIIILLVIWSLVTLFVTLFYPYARMVITLEDEDFFPAMRRSMQLAITNIKITLQFVVVTFALSIRFIVNIIVLVGVPLALIRA